MLNLKKMFESFNLGKSFVEGLSKQYSFESEKSLDEGINQYFSEAGKDFSFLSELKNSKRDESKSG